jgi:hypothetical protein
MFKGLKQKFIKVLLFVLFNLKKQIKVKIDALDFILKTVISQPNKTNK